MKRWNNKLQLYIIVGLCTVTLTNETDERPNSIIRYWSLLRLSVARVLTIITSSSSLRPTLLWGVDGAQLPIVDLLFSIVSLINCYIAASGRLYSPWYSSMRPSVQGLHVDVHALCVCYHADVTVTAFVVTLFCCCRRRRRQRSYRAPVDELSVSSQVIVHTPRGPVTTCFCDCCTRRV